MRPIELSPVGRTMLAPPPETAHATLCTVEDSVNLFGQRLTVQAMPFMSQDAQYLRCAHADLWMVLYHAHLAHGLPRRLSEEIHQAAMGGVIVGRQVPSDGLSVQQILQALDVFGMSAAQVDVPRSYQESRRLGLRGLAPTLCRYINSGMPPMVHSSNHIWLVIGYERMGEGRHAFYCHDDAHGPYLRVENPWEDRLEHHEPWQGVLTPMPQKLYMGAERAELIGSNMLRQGARAAGSAEQLREALMADEVSYRTYALRSNQFKEGVTGRQQESAGRQYRLLQLPRYVWVVEATDRRLRGHADGVLGEALIDPTYHHEAHATDLRPLLALHVPGRLLTFPPDHESVDGLDYEGFSPYRSGCAYVRD
jgi:hypothetical protein